MTSINADIKPPPRADTPRPEKRKSRLQAFKESDRQISPEMQEKLRRMIMGE